jgi:type IV conjugative transfer system protein TraL
MSYPVIKTLDNMPRLIFWPIDDVLIVIVPFFVGLCVSSFLIMLSGLVLKIFYKKIKRRYPRGAFLHRMYWSLPKSAFQMAGILKQIPASHQRDFTL